MNLIEVSDTNTEIKNIIKIQKFWRLWRKNFPNKAPIENDVLRIIDTKYENMIFTMKYYRNGKLGIKTVKLDLEKTLQNLDISKIRSLN